MGKGILKRQESIESTESKAKRESSAHLIHAQNSKRLAWTIKFLLSPFSSVKWDEEKLKISEAIKMTIPKGQIDEPKTPFQHGQCGLNYEDCADEGFKLKSGGDETEEGSLSDSSFRKSTCSSNGSCGWESSLSEVDTDMDESTESHEAFKSLRSQHYFMKQALQRGKELIETEDDEEYEFNE